LDCAHSAIIEEIVDKNSQLRLDLLHDLTAKGIGAKSQNLLANGTQTTGNLFDRPEPSFGKLHKIIQREIDDYRHRYHDKGAGLIEEFPEDFRLWGWSILMSSGGSLGSHIHTTGWLSGVVYIEVPDDLVDDEGRLEISIGGAGFPDLKGSYPKQTLPVEQGLMNLMPSSLCHRVLPFSSTGRRVCIAFDVQPR